MSPALELFSTYESGLSKAKAQPPFPSTRAARVQALPARPTHSSLSKREHHEEASCVLNPFFGLVCQEACGVQRPE